MYYYIQKPERRDALMALAEGGPSSEQAVMEVVAMIRSSDAIAEARAEAERFVQKAIEDLATLPPAPQRDALEDIARYVVEREF